MENRFKKIVFRFAEWLLTSDLRMKAASIIIWIFIIIWIVWLTSCSPTKRLNRILDNNPDLMAKKEIIIHDTTYYTFPGVQKDTTIIRTHSNSRDTLIIREQHMTIKSYVTDTTHYIYGSCDTIYDTIFKEIPVVYDEFPYRKPRDGLRWWQYLIIISIIIILFYKKII